MCTEEELSKLFLEKIGFGDLLYLSNNSAILELMDRLEKKSYPVEALNRIRFFYDINKELKRSIKIAKSSLILDEFEFECSYKNQIEVESDFLDSSEAIIDPVTVEIVLQRMIQDKIKIKD